MQNDTNLNNIIFEHVSKAYPNTLEAALHDASFSIKKGEFFCIIGPSGCGKSTILKLIAGLEEPTAGIITKPDTIGLVFQNAGLLPWSTVYDNAAVGLKAQGVSESEIEKVVLPYLSLLKLEALKDKYPRELSGGQRQRVGIARALSIEPEVLLLDEPFSALDPKTTSELHEDILKIWKETKRTIVMVSHSIEEAVTLSDTILFMAEKRVEKIIPITLKRPRRERAHEFSDEVQKIRKEFFHCAS